MEYVTVGGHVCIKSISMCTNVRANLSKEAGQTLGRVSIGVSGGCVLKLRGTMDRTTQLCHRGIYLQVSSTCVSSKGLYGTSFGWMLAGFCCSFLLSFGRVGRTTFRWVLFDVCFRLLSLFCRLDVSVSVSVFGGCRC